MNVLTVCKSWSERTRNSILLSLMLICTFFVNLGALPTDIMEVRNLVTAHEMVTDGHWLVPTMNGDLRLEKPPLPTWVAAAVDEVFPDSMTAQRAMAGVMGVMWTCFFFLIVRDLSRHNYKLTFLSVFIFLTMYQIVLMGRTATWDIYCHAFMMGGIWMLGRGLTAKTRKAWPWMLGAGVLMGLSFMSKGPVSFYALLLPMLIASIGMSRWTLKGKWLPFALMIILIVVIGGWWYAYLYIVHPDAIAAVAAKESGAWSNHNVRPWYYYWRFFLETGIWSPIMLAALAVGYWKRHLPQPYMYLFAITWTLAALVLLSLMPEKKMRYLLPMMPCCSLCVACLLVKARWAKWLVYPVCAIFMVAECFLLKPIGALFGNPDERSIALLQPAFPAEQTPLFHPKDEEVRIELVFASRHKIRPIDINNLHAWRGKDIILVTQKTPETYLSPETRNRVTLKPLGTFDDNKHPRKNSHYTGALKGYVTKIEPKNLNNE